MRTGIKKKKDKKKKKEKKECFEERNSLDQWHDSQRDDPDTHPNHVPSVRWLLRRRKQQTQEEHNGQKAQHIEKRVVVTACKLSTQERTPTRHFCRMRDV
jgi:hypothetical protein